LPELPMDRLLWWSKIAPTTRILKQSQSIFQFCTHLV